MYICISTIILPAKLKKEYLLVKVDLNLLKVPGVKNAKVRYIRKEASLCAGTLEVTSNSIK